MAKQTKSGESEQLDKAGGDRTEEELLADSSILENPETAVAACVQYLLRFPTAGALPDIAATMTVLNHLRARTGPHKIERSATINTIELAGNVKWPMVLKNGLVTSARTRNAVKADAAVTAIRNLEQLEAGRLEALFKEATSEVERLMPNGQSLAQQKDITFERAMADALIYYKAYEEDRFDDARRGFEYLKTLNPLEGYFRNMLGATYSSLQMPEEALREWLMGFSLKPSDVSLANNLVVELIQQTLIASAIVVFRHHKKYVDDKNTDSNVVASLERANKHASFITAVLACRQAGITGADVEATESDQLDTLQDIKRPWLIDPEIQALERDRISLKDKRIFISYRRAQSTNAARRLRESLKVAVPSLFVFLDEEEIAAGGMFEAQLSKEIRDSDVFVVLVDRSWTSASGLARLNEATDVLRRELAYAFSLGKGVLPILVEEAPMPAADLLPENIRELTSLSALPLREASLLADVIRIEKAMVDVLGARQIRVEKLAAKINEIADLEKRDPKAGKIARENWFAAALKSQVRLVLSVKAPPGIGVPRGLVVPDGKWDCKGTYVNGDQLSITFETEERRARQFHGLISRRSPSSQVIAENKVRGEWATLEDDEKDLSLGIRLTCVIDGVEPFDIDLPFHREIAGTFTGRDDAGTSFTCRNISPRRPGILP